MVQNPASGSYSPQNKPGAPAPATKPLVKGTQPFGQRSKRIGVAPLVAQQPSEEAIWLGATLSRLLTLHLDAAGLDIVDYNSVARQCEDSNLTLPLTPTGIGTLKDAMRLHALIHGRYTFDEAGRLLGFSLIIDAPNVAATPLEAAAPHAGFSRFIERITLALVERLGESIDDQMRKSIRGVLCPANFEAFRRVASAHAAWNRGDNELALASVEAALQLDPMYEEAVAIQVAISRDANDVETADKAFQRWVELAEKRGDRKLAAERTLLRGHWMLERAEWDLAQSAYETARDINRRDKDAVGEALALDNLANLDLARGSAQNAIKTYRRSLRVFQNAPDSDKEIALIYYNLSLAHKQLGQRDEATKAADEAINRAKQVHHPRLEARALAQRGAILAENGEWTQASADFTRAAGLLDVHGDDVGRAIVKSHQALLLKHQGAYDRSETLFIEALEILEQQPLQYPQEQAVIWLSLADLYFAMHLYDQSWLYVEQARAAFEEFGAVAWASRADDIVNALESLPQPDSGQQPPADQFSSQGNFFTTDGPADPDNPPFPKNPQPPTDF